MAVLARLSRSLAACRDSELLRAREKKSSRDKEAGNESRDPGPVPTEAVSEPVSWCECVSGDKFVSNFFLCVSERIIVTLVRATRSGG